MGQTIRLTESQFMGMISESVRMALDEVARYDNTMKAAGKAFDQNTFMGRLRSRLQPGKYQQYRRIGQQADQMGAEAADTLNDTLDSMGDSETNHGAVICPDFDNYYRQHNQGPDQDKYYNVEGERQFNRDHATQLGHINKYGTGGRLTRPYGWDTDQLADRREAYTQQRQMLRGRQG